MLFSSTRTNQLIEGLPAASRRRLLADAEPVELAYRETVVAHGEALSYVYFPTASFVSMLVPVDGARVEVALVGREGMIGMMVAMDAPRSDVECVVQGAGEALRVRASRFRAHLVEDDRLRARVQRLGHSLLTQLARNAACHRFHQVEQRLARWLLRGADRASSATFEATHAFLAEALGVRRVGVTTAARELQRRGLIKYSRGVVGVRDRDGLRRAACSCYRADLEAYRDSSA